MPTTALSIINPAVKDLKRIQSTMLLLLAENDLLDFIYVIRGL